MLWGSLLDISLNHLRLPHSEDTYGQEISPSVTSNLQVTYSGNEKDLAQPTESGCHNILFSWTDAVTPR